VLNYLRCSRVRVAKLGIVLSAVAVSCGAIGAGSLSSQADAAPVTGGLIAGKPADGKPTVAGVKAKLTSAGIAIAPATAPLRVKRVIAAANRIAKTPYLWGGGHASWISSGYDCSGSTSFALHGGGLLNAPIASGFYEMGDAGEGKWITTYANSYHVYMEIAGLRYDTSALDEGGSRWSSKPRNYGSGFVARHPVGL